MDRTALTQLLQQLQSQEVGVDDVVQRLSQLPFSDIGFARVDHHRELRQGIPEVVFGENKTAAQIVGICTALLNAGQSVLVTRVTPDKAELIVQDLPELQYHPSARTLRKDGARLAGRRPRFARPVAVVTAGTSDQPVADEAAETLMAAGERVDRFSDVGVAGIHRLFEALPRIQQAPAVICVAGMEGALPSVLGGMLSAPLVAVPTSVGYGAAFDGVAALLGMLTGCASGVSVVNIDNGFGAAMTVLRMGNLVEASREAALEEQAESPRESEA